MVCILIIGASPLMGTDEKSVCRRGKLSTLSFNLPVSQLGGNFFTPDFGFNNIHFWSIDDGRLKNIIELGKGESAWLIALSHDGNLMAADESGCYSFKEK